MTTDFTPWLDWLDGQQDEMLRNTIALAEINSGTFNAQGVNQVGKKLIELFAPLGGDVEIIPVAPYQNVNAKGEVEAHALGDAIRIRKRTDAPLQVFFCGHMDTVFAVNHPFQTVKWLDDDTLNGPGVADLKGGLMVMLNAIAALERSPWAEKIGWEILFNPDEEIGSQGSAPLIADAAKRVHLGMIYEPSFPDGNLAGERKGSGNFSVVIKGRAAHAGREHHLGRNAIRAMCDFISALDDLNGKREGVTINPGFIEGGGAVNIVPDLCISRFNIRLERPEDERWCQNKLADLVARIHAREGILIELHGGFTRKPKVLSPANLKLFELAQACGKDLGMQLQWLPTGGCCDGNNLAAAGIPNIDTLGVQGGKIHSADEYVKVSSLSQRAKLSALMLMKLAASDDLSWLEP
ncbi:glutamate carboxypeptidase [Oceanospirillum multiglobuliferum]|uniref:Acetylornithine deacetylase n=1 Tax=Oceanospirillum multiglobuliferum TaxID=64969 RepID=A0A1T4QUA4_9GAMM|nr:hydrolase [Oceanospirillum multiglobuliferum]OPX57126.1 acetylornithine deacetylase [Oceanospirillum multiglobuliferum]SKA07061.1 glutamate carboxypeptidase [Oceanospirillum multiglobuliferum]